MLAVIDHEQEMPRLQPLDETVEGSALVHAVEAKRRSDVLDEHSGIVEIRALDPSGAIRKRVL
jgi:hypothetical protein